MTITIPTNLTPVILDGGAVLFPLWAFGSVWRHFSLSQMGAPPDILQIEARDAVNTL